MSTYVQMYSREYLLGTIWFVCVYEEKGDIMMAVEILYTTRYYYTKVCRYVLLMMVPILP